MSDYVQAGTAAPQENTWPLYTVSAGSPNPELISHAPKPEPKLWLRDQLVEELEKSQEQEDRVAISIIRRNLQHAKREYAKIEFDLHYREEEFAKMYPQPNDVEDHQLDSRRV